ncbi:hypothetical protein RFI_04791, partial [Reticulomyxa filosa]
KSRIQHKLINIKFVDNKFWSAYDECKDDKITGKNLQKLPIILNSNWGCVVNDIEKETKNMDIMRSVQYILEAITNSNIQVASQATISGSKSDTEIDMKSTVFPDLMWSSNNIMYGKSELENPFIVIDYKIPGKIEVFDNNKDKLDEMWTKGCSDIDAIIEENTRNNSKKTKASIETSLVNPILQIACYMAWSGAKVGMLIAYPRCVWFEVDSIDSNGKFTINVYPMLKMNSFEDAMLEFVRITKYAKTLSPNKKYFRQKNNNIEEDNKIKDEIEDDEQYDEMEQKKIINNIRSKRRRHNQQNLNKEEVKHKILTRKNPKKRDLDNINCGKRDNIDAGISCPLNPRKRSRRIKNINITSTGPSDQEKNWPNDLLTLHPIQILLLQNLVLQQYYILVADIQFQNIYNFDYINIINK